MKLLILGGGGFIGSSLLPWLLQAGHSLRVFDRVPPRAPRGAFPLEDIDYWEGTFSEETDFSSLLNGIDAVLHLVSSTHAGSRLPYAQEVRENILPTLALLDACLRHGTGRVVFLSSGGTVYGPGTGQDFKEDDALRPINPYGVQKLCIEKYLDLYTVQHGLDTRIIRPSNPYGPLQNPRGGQGAVAAFCHAAVCGEPITVFGDGSVVRDYLYIDDLSRGVVRLLAFDGAERVFNLGTGRGHSLREIIACLEDTLQRPVQVSYGEKRPGDVPRSVLDVGRYKALCQPPPFIPLAEGVRRMVAHYADAGSSF